MRILTWNCNGAFRNKLNSLDCYQADIIVIQECEDPSRTTDKVYKDWAKNSLWVGENKNKGLGIFANESIKLTCLDWSSDGLKYFIPCRVNDDFNLLGAWCHGANSPTFGYIGQLWKYLQLHKTKLGKSIIAGDFNTMYFGIGGTDGGIIVMSLESLKNIKLKAFIISNSKKNKARNHTQLFICIRIRISLIILTTSSLAIVFQKPSKLWKSALKRIGLTKVTTCQ